jgi:N-acetylglucosamine malate deacetylase 2
VEMAFYHSSAGRMETGSFVPDYGTSWVTAILAPEERRFKEQLFACYRSQARVLQSFQLELERFRVAPYYDFTQPPHCGRLYYENYDWGITGEGWRKLATECFGELGLV